MKMIIPQVSEGEKQKWKDSLNLMSNVNLEQKEEKKYLNDIFSKLEKSRC